MTKQIRLRRCLFVVGVLVSACLDSFASGGNEAETVLWYQQPARDWQREALPIGNGRLGAMVFGGVLRERIALNEDTVWSGMRTEWNRKDAYKNLPAIRELLLAGKNAEAEALVNKTFTCTGGGSRGGPNGPWGCYQELGNLRITWDTNAKPLELKQWKYKMVTTPGITDIRKHRREVARLVTAAAQPDTDDSEWADYLIEDGEAVEGARRLSRNDKVILRHHLRLTAEEIEACPVLRIAPPARNGRVFVNGHEVGNLPGWRDSGHDIFEQDVRPHLREGDNVIAIYCSNYRRRGQLPLSVRLDPSEQVQNYRRALDLRDAIATVEYQRDGISFKREAFSSAPDQVMVFRFTADQPGAISFQATMDRLANAETRPDGANGLLMMGRTFARRGKEGLTFVARLHAKTTGGSVVVDGDTLTIEDADEVVLLVSAGTDYVGFGGRNTPDPLQATRDDIAKTTAKTYDTLRAAHVADHRSYFDRMSLHLDDGSEESRAMASLPTDARHAALREGKPDPAFAALYFNYGRYLLISSSRPGCMPANLQGLWAEGIATPWNCDYHLDINVQMNYWPAEMCGLGDCHTPLFKLIESLQEPGAITAKTYYNADGWVAHVITNPWGFTAPGEQAGWGATATGSPWLCDHLWEHYAYNRDRQFLQWAYPIMKGSAVFFLDMLIKDPKTGWLVTAPSNSPENTFIMANGKRARVCMGPTMDMQILRELFGNCIQAADILGIDQAFRDKLAETSKQLAPNQIGKHGQIQEWLEDYDEAKPKHRHVSPLYGLHPYDEITPEKTPELAEAARTTLKRRGDRGTGWSMAWKVNFWARLHDGNHALLLLNNLIKKGGQNLLCQHAPFQIDGNFGGTSGIGEMLLQSQDSVIHLLPALPDAWPNGEMMGIRARGGYAVDMKWADGELVRASLQGLENATGHVSVRYAGKTMDFDLPAGKERQLTVGDFSTLGRSNPSKRSLSKDKK